MSKTDGDIGDVADAQIEQQGVASFRCEDGQVFVFTIATLERLLVAAHENGGKALVFVKAGATS